MWRKDGKVQDKADDGSLLWRRGRCALRDDLTDMTVPQLQGCYRATESAVDTAADRLLFSQARVFIDWLSYN